MSIKKVLLICLILVVMMTGCATEKRKKEQYVEIENYKDDTKVHIMPNNDRYEELVEKIAMACVEEAGKKIPSTAEKYKKICFYQAPTETIFVKNKSDVKLIVEINIYREGDEQYAVCYLPVTGKYTFKITEELEEILDLLENS